MAGRAYKTSSWELEVGGSEFKASLGYIQRFSLYYIYLCVCVIKEQIAGISKFVVHSYYVEPRDWTQVIRFRGKSPYCEADSSCLFLVFKWQKGTFLSFCICFSFVLLQIEFTLRLIHNLFSNPILIKNYYRGWEDGSAIKSTCCTSRVPGLDFWHPGSSL